MAMTEAKICENVLGHRSGYVKRLGFDPKLDFSFKSGHTYSQREVELENRHSYTQVLVEA